MRTLGHRAAVLSVFIPGTTISNYPKIRQEVSKQKTATCSGAPLHGGLKGEVSHKVIFKETLPLHGRLKGEVSHKVIFKETLPLHGRLKGEV